MSFVNDLDSKQFGLLVSGLIKLNFEADTAYSHDALITHLFEGKSRMDSDGMSIDLSVRTASLLY
jgi:hypothetical protein